MILVASGSLSDAKTGRSAGGTGVGATDANPATTEGILTLEAPCISVAGVDIEACVSGHMSL